MSVIPSQMSVIPALDAGISATRDYRVKPDNDTRSPITTHEIIHSRTDECHSRT